MSRMQKLHYDNLLIDDAFYSDRQQKNQNALTSFFSLLFPDIIELV
jgi:hypothetical protein